MRVWRRISWKAPFFILAAFIPVLRSPLHPSSVLAASCLPIQLKALGAVPGVAQIKKALERLGPEDRPLFMRAFIGFVPLDSDKLNLSEKFQASFESPQALFSNDSPTADGGSTLFHGNIFVEGYFRVSGILKKLKGESMAQVRDEQPWLRWRPEIGEYQLEHGGTQMPLLEPYLRNGKLTLYRGLTRGLTQAPPQKEVFFTPNLETAKAWARSGNYLEITLDPSEIRDLYAGIEYNAVEVAILDSRILDRIFQHDRHTLRQAIGSQAPDALTFWREGSTWLFSDRSPARSPVRTRD